MPRGKAHARARLSRTGKRWWRGAAEAAPAVGIANGYLPGVTVGGIRVRCSAAAPACGSARSRCSDLPSGALGMEGAAPFSGGESEARNPGRVERTGYDHAQGQNAHANDEIPRHSRLLFLAVRRVRPLVGHVPGPVQTWLVRGVGSPTILAGGLDSAPPICTLARFEVRAS